MFTNPILSNFKNFRLYLFFRLIIIAIYLSILNFGIKADLYFILIDSVVFNLIFCGLGLSFWFSVRFLPLERNNLSKIIFTHIFVGVLLTIIWLFLGYNIISLFKENYLKNKTMKYFEQYLDPNLFIRIHHSHLTPIFAGR